MGWRRAGRRRKKLAPYPMHTTLFFANFLTLLTPKLYVLPNFTPDIYRTGVHMTDAHSTFTVTCGGMRPLPRDSL